MSAEIRSALYTVQQIDTIYCVFTDFCAGKAFLIKETPLLSSLSHKSVKLEGAGTILLI